MNVTARIDSSAWTKSPSTVVTHPSDRSPVDPRTQHAKDPNGSCWVPRSQPKAQTKPVDPNGSCWIPRGQPKVQTSPVDPNGSCWIPRSQPKAQTTPFDPNGSCWDPRQYSKPASRLAN